MFDFTEEELNRYSRHILLQDVGVEGQEKIREGKVLVIGAGGLGAPVAMYLAAAGVGTIGIVDGDVVDLSNLQRQIIHTTPDVDKWKVESAKETINAINPHVKVNAHREFLMADNALDLIKEYDFVVDGTDNFPVKFLTRARPSPTYQAQPATVVCSRLLHHQVLCRRAVRLGCWEPSRECLVQFRRQRH